MISVNMPQAKSFLSKLVDILELGREQEIIITRNGRPAAKLVPIEAVSTSKRIGVAKGIFKVPDRIDANNDEVARMFDLP